MHSVLEPFDQGLDVLEALLELIQAPPILVLRLRVPEEAQPLADALSPTHSARLAASLRRRRSCARSWVRFIV
jgi:hypothetical protein